jgi:hypothetical protein
VSQIPILPGVYVGRGVDSITAKTYGSAISFDEPQIQEEAPGQQVDFMLESITSSRELLDKLDLSVTVSFSFAKWGASAEFKLSQSQTINSYYTYALVRVLVQNPPLLLRNPKFLPEAKELLVQKGWEEFAKSYGWEFVEGVITGGSYYGLIEIQTTNETEQKEIKAKLGVYYGPFKLDASFTRTLEDISKTTATNVRVIQSGGSGDVIETGLEEMIEQAVNFTKMAKENPVPIALIVNDYRSNVPIPLNVIDADNLSKINQKNILSDMGRLYLRLRDYKSNLQFVLDNLRKFDDYRDYSEEELQQKRAAFQGSLEKTAQITDRICALSEIYASDYHKCETYVLDSGFEFIALPTIGGELMTIRQLEEKIAALEAKFNGPYLSVEGAAGEKAYIGGDGSGSPNPASMDVQMGSHNPGVEKIHFWNTGAGKLMDATAKTLYLGGDIDMNGSDGNGGSHTIHSSARLHISGEELLYLLNKAGVNISKAWGGNGNLTVEGEIRGKMRYTGSFRWQQGQPPVKMIHSGQGFAILTLVTGKFEGGGEHVRVYVADDGYWYLGGDSMQKGVAAEAICVGNV